MSRVTREPPASPALIPPHSTPRPDDLTARRSWRGAYLGRLVASDAVCGLLAAAAGVATQPAAPVLPPPLLVLALAAGWVASLLLARCYDLTVLGEGTEEFRRVVVAGALVLAGVAVYAWAGQEEVPRGYVALSLALAVCLTLVTRWAQRLVLRHARTKGTCVHRTLLVGHRRSVTAVHHRLCRRPALGYRAIGCCLPPADRIGPSLPDLPVLGGPRDVVDVVRRYHVDTVAVLPSAALDGDALQQLAWDLQRTRTDLVLAPPVSEIAGPKVRVRLVCGIPVLQVGHRPLRGARRLVKAAFDRVGAGLLLLLLAPLLGVVAVAVKVESAGHVFVRQPRLGEDGRVFQMLRFRTTDHAQRSVTDSIRFGHGDGALVTMRLDPHVTRVGAILRRYYLDELPQLLHVLSGEMSLVGPRPPMARDLEGHGSGLRDRLAVKPGLTGLWQVSRHADLAPDESLRADLLYATNWSLTLDLLLLWRACRAVFRKKPAAER